MLRRALRHRDVQAFLGVNRYNDVLWFNRESFEAWLWWLLCLDALEGAELDDDAFVARFTATYTLVTQLRSAEAQSEYRVDTLIEAAEGLDTL